MDRKIPALRTLLETAAHWQATDESRLLAKRRSVCNALHHDPRDLCPHCLSDATDGRPAAGTGTGAVYAFSTPGRGDAACTLALVTPDEGMTMRSTLLAPADADATSLAGFAVNQRVRVVVPPSEGGHAVPMFTPVPA